MLKDYQLNLMEKMMIEIVEIVEMVLVLVLVLMLV
jgi:hypothetical protein